MAIQILKVNMASFSQIGHRNIRGSLRSSVGVLCGRQHTFSARRRRVNLATQAGRDYYNILGVGKSADKKEIKSAYRQKARKFHPDVNKEPDAADRFKEISEAYEVLQDDQKRQIYDTYGEEGLKGGMGGMGGMGGFTDPFEIFEAFFGGRGFGGMGAGFGGAGISQQPLRGENEEYDIVIEFMDAVFGCQRKIETSRLVTCQTCSGSGVKSGTQSTCTQCKGQGRMAQRLSTPLGELQQITTCPMCGGAGTTSEPCGTCGGDGRVRSKQKVEVSIPAGIDDGLRLRLAGEGSAGRRGGPPGDMFVQVRVKKHPQLERREYDIHSEVEISYTEAILGTNVTILTVDGEVDMKIPQGTQPGTTLKLAGRGVPKLGSRNQRGDQLVHVRVKIPEKISGEERELVEQLRQMSKPTTKVGVGRFKF
eukprot:TRINITY_DN3007_c0_g1_i1.p1 TRINITY_DN3007_c0_g1~~TRINITY_DN3007_c0_g1_i1.p1  ORF type:complete len:422 (+),score=41.81 TRINITY_DN3007_c0_g1_i1:38-1303(+)